MTWLFFMHKSQVMTCLEEAAKQPPPTFTIHPRSPSFD